MGCGSGSSGVDDDFVGVAMNFICCVILLGTTLRFAIAYFKSHDPFFKACGAVGMSTEFGMSLGYLFGGVVHGWFSNRASSSHCASRWFYPLFSISYLTMVWSAWNWVGVGEVVAKLHRQDLGQSASMDRTLRMCGLGRAVHLARCFLVKPCMALCGLLIATGALSCQLSGDVKLYAGNTDDCEGGGAPAMCDAVFAAGEAIFYVVWVLVWVLVAVEVQWVLRLARTAKHMWINWLAPIALLLGPGQILAVSVTPLLVYGVGEGQAKALEWYCNLHVGITYIWAVLVSHLLSSLLMDRALFVRGVGSSVYTLSSCALPLRCGLT